MGDQPGFIAADWPAPAHVRAGTTTRHGGVGSGAFATLNLGAHVGDDPDVVARNRARLRGSLALPSEPLWLDQVHGCRVLSAQQADGAERRADAVWAQRPGVVCAVLTADCLPVVFVDRAGTRIAAAHAGWRGLAGGVLESTVQALGGGGELMAWLGPAIGPEAFEVGAEVRAAFMVSDPQAEPAFRPSPAGRWLADLYVLARQRLARAGVTAVYGGGHCVYQEADTFFSYRRSAVTGRMATLIWLTNGSGD